MRIIDENGIEITNPDYTIGHTVDDVLIIHHEAILAVKEESHIEVVAEYPNGGKDIVTVIDVPGREAQDAWDETEAILRYVLYTEQELKEIRIAKLEEQLASYYWIATEIQIGIGTAEDYAAEIAEARELRRQINELKKE